MILAHFAETWPRRRSEWLLATMITGLGVVYTLSPGLFDRPFFHAMRMMMPQEWWALICMVVGMTRLAFLVINGTMLPLSPAVRCMFASASCAVWVALTIAAVLNDFAGQTLAVWPSLLLFELFVVFETASEWGRATRREGGSARATTEPARG